MDILKVVLASLFSIVILFLLCKWIGKRQIGQLSMFDYINSITIGSIAAELATNLEEWEKPLTAMLVYGAATVFINILTCKSLALRKFFNGKPIVLYEHGTLYKANLMRAKLDINEFLTQCRVAGYFDLTQLEAAVLETNGQISFLPLSQERPVTPADLQLKPQQEQLAISLILDGKILPDNLRDSGRDEAWLQKQLHSQDIGQISDVFLAYCDMSGAFHAFRMEEKPMRHDIFE